MNWSSWSDFLAMGGYGLYVWGAYAMTLALMAIEPWLAHRQRAQALQEASRITPEEHDA